MYQMMGSQLQSLAYQKGSLALFFQGQMKAYANR